MLTYFLSRRFLIKVAVCLVGFMLFFGSMIKVLNDTDVMRNGAQTSGQITDKSPFLEYSNDGNSFQRYQVEFTYQDTTGASFSNSSPVEKGAYDSYVIGDSIQVYYYPTDPILSFVDLDGKITISRNQIIIGALMGILGLIALFSDFRKLRNSQN